MASACGLKRKVLLSVIRAPTLSQQRSSVISLVQIHAFHTTPIQRKEGFSITFGSQIDDLLSSGNKGAKGPSVKRRSKKSPTKSSLSKTSTSNTTDPTVQAAPSPDGSKGAIRDLTAGQTTDSRSHPAEQPRTERAVNQDGPTLDLSEDAYDVISRPAGYRDKTNLSEDSEDTIATDYDLASRKSNRPQVQANNSTQTSRPNVKTQKSPPAAWKPHKKLEPWQIQKKALENKFGEEGWNPRKKLSPDALEGIRSLHAEDPTRYSTALLSSHFKVSPEAIRRILRSKWRPSAEIMEDRRERWARRHDRIWDQKAALGLRPARETNRKPEDPEAFEEEVKAKKMLGQL